MLKIKRKNFFNLKIKKFKINVINKWKNIENWIIKRLEKLKNQKSQN